MRRERIHRGLHGVNQSAGPRQHREHGDRPHGARSTSSARTSAPATAPAAIVSIEIRDPRRMMTIAAEHGPDDATDVEGR